MKRKTEPFVATQMRGGEWWWRFEWVAGYEEWHGPYPTMMAAAIAGGTEKRRLNRAEFLQGLQQ
jgi:hypothetical protein